MSTGQDIEWWGYQHTNGSIQVKRWFGDPRDIPEALESPFVNRVFMPFSALGRDDAIDHIRELL